MHVIVLGAGVIGVTSAYFLARAGHEVTVLDARTAPALGASYGSGGQIAAAHVEPLAGPGMPLRILKWLGRRDAPLHLPLWRLIGDPALLAWGSRFLANCTEARTRINAERILRIALYSRKVLDALRAETGITYDQSESGILHLYRDPKAYARALGMSGLWRELGLHRSDKTPEECVQLEPALEPLRHRLIGGIHAERDESGDSHMFALKLAGLAEAAGVDFQYRAEILDVEFGARRLRSVRTERGVWRADAYVLCLGVDSLLFARRLGMRLPVYPTKGYSITVDVVNDNAAPRLSLTDDDNKLVYSRLGDRLRVAGIEELNGFNETMHMARANMIRDKARALFPDAGDFSRPHFWVGLRPKTPDSVPIVGTSPIDNLLLNTGHGTHGWTMACGSAQLIADLIGNRTPDIDPRGLSLDRF